MNSLFLAVIIVLTPIDEYMGVIPEVKVCDFAYAPGTILAPGTKLTIESFTETYGEGSVIPPGSGMSCNGCYVSKITMDSVGVTRIYCE